MGKKMGKWVLFIWVSMQGGSVREERERVFSITGSQQEMGGV